MTDAHFEPLRPHRSVGIQDRCEFAHGANSVCAYDIRTMDFVKEIRVGVEPDCHSTSLDNRFLYIACAESPAEALAKAGGLWIIAQESLEVVKVLDTGHVYATNVMPDGETMLLHDAFGGILVLKDIQDMARIRVHKRLDVLGTNTCRDTLGGKGHFIGDGRYYLCAAWEHARIFAVDLENDCAFEEFMADPLLAMGDDLVVSRDKTRAYVACYQSASCVAVVDLANRRVMKTIRTGRGTCGLTMTNDERYVIASNDQDDSISVIDTETDEVVSTPCARPGFEKLGITGYIQGISVGPHDEVYVYGCSGNGALVRFEDIISSPRWTISYPGGKLEPPRRDNL